MSPYSPSPSGPSKLVRRFFGTLALTTSLIYLAWRTTTLLIVPWLSIPLFLLELWGAAQLSLLVTQTWHMGTEAEVREPGTPAVKPALVVTCTFHPIEAVERTLLAARTLRYVGEIVVVMRPAREDVAELCERLGVPLLVSEGNHVDAFWKAAQAAPTELVAWLEAGQVPAPDFVRVLAAEFADPDVAVVQASVGLLNDDSLAHLEGGRDEAAFARRVLFPALSRKGIAPWQGGGSMVRRTSLEAIGGPEPTDQAALQRAAVLLQTTGWKTEYTATSTLVRDSAPDDLATYLLVRRRRVIEALRVFGTPQNPLRSKGLSFSGKVGHLWLAASFGTGVRQLGLVTVLVMTLATGRLPVGSSASIWAVLWIPAFAFGVAARHVLANHTMAIGDWTRQGWRTASADLSAFGEVTGLRRRRLTLDVSSDQGFRALGKLRLLTSLVIALDVVLMARGLTLIWPRLLPRFTTSGRILAFGIGLVVLAGLLDVLQVAVRRNQRRAQHRLKTSIAASVKGAPLRVVDLSPTGMGAISTTDVQLAVNDEVAIELILPDATSTYRHAVELNGVVRSDTMVGGSRRIGVQFSAFSPDARDALIEYCAVGHHVTDEEPHALVVPGQFDVARQHPGTTRVLSSSAALVGIATLFAGPAALPALADVAMPAKVCVLSSTGVGHGEAEISFRYDGKWHALGSTDKDGCVEGDMPPRKTRVVAVHQGIRNEVRQDLAADPKVVFKTVPLTVTLTDSTGNPIPDATANYRAGKAWNIIGTTDKGGTATTEVLPHNARVNITHNAITTQARQQLAKDPNIIFKTVPLTVTLTDSTGNPIPNATASYRRGRTWMEVGATDKEGMARIEVLPANVRVGVAFNGRRTSTVAKVREETNVQFSTVAVAPEDGETITSFRSRGWHDYKDGTEFLPGKMRFRMDDGSSHRVTLKAGSVTLLPSGEFVLVEETEVPAGEPPVVDPEGEAATEPNGENPDGDNPEAVANDTLEEEDEFGEDLTLDDEIQDESGLDDDIIEADGVDEENEDGTDDDFDADDLFEADAQDGSEPFDQPAESPTATASPTVKPTGPATEQSQPTPRPTPTPVTNVSPPPTQAPPTPGSAASATPTGTEEEQDKPFVLELDPEAVEAAQADGKPTAAPTASVVAPTPTQVVEATPTPTTGPTVEDTINQGQNPGSESASGPVRTREVVPRAGDQIKPARQFQVTATASGRPQALRVDLVPSEAAGSQADIDGRLSYALSITNTAETELASPVQVTLDFNDFDELEVADTGAWACDAADRMLTCTLDEPMAATERAQFGVSGSIAPAGTLTVDDKAGAGTDHLVLVAGLLGLCVAIGLPRYVVKRHASSKE